MKKAQAGTPAATLVGILTLLFIFYILFLPPAERTQLLQDDTRATTTGSGKQLHDTIGILTASDKGTYDHSIPNLYLSDERNAIVFSQENAFVVSKGWFGEQKHTTRFTIPNIEATENVILTLQTPTRTGTLTILLNGNIIFEGQIQTTQPGPLQLPKALLAETNTIDYYVDGSWLSRKRYEFLDVKIIGEQKDTTRSIATHTFTIPTGEYQTLETTQLDYYAICDQKNAGTLTIELNGNTISTTTPACDSLNRHDLYKEDLKDGKNTITLTITKGAVRLEDARVRNHVKGTQRYTNYFTIQPSDYNKVLDQTRNVMLNIEFLDDNKNKKAEVTINNNKIMIDQKEPTYERDISKLVKDGTNTIDVNPKTDIHILTIDINVI